MSETDTGGNLVDKALNHDPDRALLQLDVGFRDALPIDVIIKAVLTILERGEFVSWTEFRSQLPFGCVAVDETGDKVWIRICYADQVWTAENVRDLRTEVKTGPYDRGIAILAGRPDPDIVDNCEIAPGVTPVPVDSFIDSEVSLTEE